MNPYAPIEPYVAYFLKLPDHQVVFKRLSKADIKQFAYLAWLENGQPREFSRNVLNTFRAYIRRYAHRYSVEVHSSFFVSRDTAEEANEILRFYETHTATETIREFNLPDTRKVRKLLSAALPKPFRNSGKDYGEKRVKVHVNGTFRELRKQGLPKATASRTARRGYFYKPIN